MTNHIELRSVDQFLADFKPTYPPVMPSLLRNSQQYTVEEGTLNFKRVEAIGDLQAKVFGSKDNLMHQIHSTIGSKAFKKYFLAAQYVQSQLQNREGYEQVLAQVLDEHNKQNDILFLTGGGTAANNVINNGLFWSADANYIVNSEYTVQKDATDDHLADLYSKIMSLMETANTLDGDKMIMFYGANVINKINGLFVENKAPFLKTLQDALPAVGLAKMPAAITPASSHGLLIINLDQIKTHYSVLPQVRKQGINDEKEYAWSNFLMGSSMVDCLNMGAIIKQPLAFEA